MNEQIEQRRAYHRAWYAKNAAKERARGKEKYSRTKGQHNARVMRRYWAKKDSINAQQRQHYEDTKDTVLHRTWAWRLLNDFGVSIEQYNAMLAAQKGVCAICKKKCRRRLGVDHCHATGKVRGLLCHSCNIALGLLKDSLASAEAVVSYLKAAQ